MRPSVVLVLLLVTSACLFAGSLFAGATSLDDPTLVETLLELRLARGAVAYLAGAALAVSGVIAQGLFRNPLASTDILGTSAGATFAGKVSLLLFQALLIRGQLHGLEPEMILPVGCLTGGLHCPVHPARHRTRSSQHRGAPAGRLSACPICS